MASEGESNGRETTQVKEGTKDGWLGMPWWYYLVILDALIILVIATLLVTDNPQDRDEYLLATEWSFQILAFLYLAVALFGMTRTAIRGKEVNVVAWGMMLIVGFAIIGSHWVAPAGISLVMVAHVVVAGLSKSE